MKKLLSLILSLSLLLLSGCGGIYANFRELEDIRVIQTMGIDWIPGGVQLSLASANAESEDKEALCLSASGSTISAALENIRSSSSQDDLFLSHIKQIVIGEEAARRGLEPYLSYICRSEDLRIDTPLFIVKGKTAQEVMSQSGSGLKGISEIFHALRSNESQHRNSRIIPASQLINNLNKQGSGLVSMLEYIPAAENSGKQDEEKEMTASLSGYALIGDYKLLGYWDSENALGVDFLLNKVGISDITVCDPEGRPVSMEISSGSSNIEPIWEANDLVGINIKVYLKAMVLELQDSQDLSSHELSDYLLSQLESYVSSKLSYVLQSSRKLHRDFTGLSGIINMQEPLKYASMEKSFEEILPSLKMQISVSAELSHTKDIKDGGN